MRKKGQHLRAPVSIVGQAGCASGSIWMGAENLAPTRVGSVRGSNPAGGNIFRTRQYRPWRPIQDPAEWLQGLFPWDKAAGARPWLPTPSSAKVKERVELYLWSFMACPMVNFTFTLPRIKNTYDGNINLLHRKIKTFTGSVVGNSKRNKTVRE
jgi:hypothetical protein